MALINSDVIPASATTYEIDQSLRFNDDDSAYLSRTPSVTGNRKTWTWSGWVKRGNLTRVNLISASNTNLGFSISDEISMNLRGGATNYFVTTNAKYRDPSAWYHIVLAVDTTQATASNRAKLYVNGEQVTSFSSASYPPQNDNLSINDTTQHLLGQETGGYYYFDGYLAETHFIDGQALTPSDFGETGTYGEWKPIKYTGTYGTNGFYLDFSNSGSLGADVSGNSNNWTPTNLAATDQMLDSPTNNFCTMNPIGRPIGTFQEGNLQEDYVASTSPASWSSRAAFGFSSGKYYWEYAYITAGSNHAMMVGVTQTDANLSLSSSSLPCWYYNGYNGYKGTPGTYAAYGDAFFAGDILGVAVDADNGTIEFYNNGVSQGVAFTGQSFGEIAPSIVNGGDNQSHTYVANFGQDSSFAGNKSTGSSNASDDNGYGDFYYTPPTGYLALCTQNLPDPTVIPSEHFSTSLWTGNGTSQSITGVGFQPDLVWHKARSYTHWHGLVDAVRGNDKYMWSNTTSAEYTDTTRVTSFDSDGFSVGSQANVNENGTTFVAWYWKANGSGVSNTDGTITSTVSANVDAGFSIITYTGNATAGATIGHGLTKAPEMVIAKVRSAVENWECYHEALGGTKRIYLNLTNAAATSANAWNDTDPSSTVITLGGGGGTNASGADQLIYAFHSVDGFSKVGSYTGNGSTDGTFVYTGFRPAYVMIKGSDHAHGWIIWDTERDTYNVMGSELFAHSSQAEYYDLTYTAIDFLSNGFKLRTNNTSENSGSNIFIAFAEHPFKHTNAR